MQGQLEARLQATKTSDIKEGQEDKLFIIRVFPFTEMIYYILQAIFTTTIDFATWPPLQIMPDHGRRNRSGLSGYGRTTF